MSDMVVCAEAVRLACCGPTRIAPFLFKWVLSKRGLGCAWRWPVGEGSFSPDRGPPVRAEIVHESERTRVTRLFLSGRTVIRKEPLGPDAQGRLQHEVAMLQRLRGRGRGRSIAR